MKKLEGSNRGREEGAGGRKEGAGRRKEGAGRRKEDAGGRKESAEGRKEGKWVWRKGARMEGEQEEGEGVAKSGKRQTLLSSSYANFLSMKQLGLLLLPQDGMLVH